MKYTSEQLAKINDTLRVNLIINSCDVEFEGVKGKMMLTRQVADLPYSQMIELLVMIAKVNTFSPDNDPHGEHDFGSIDAFGDKWFWKFDYYDSDLTYFGHHTHVLTIMHSSDY